MNGEKLKEIAMRHWGWIETGNALMPEFDWEAIARELASPAAPKDDQEPKSWKGVRWIDSINASNLAEEIALHFAHDCHDSMCGEDADESNCEVAWIEDKLSDFLDAQVSPRKEQP